MKKHVKLILLLLLSTPVLAQNLYQDVVYLKNGSIIRGIIIEQVPNTSIKIETAERNVFVYTMDEIEKLTKEKDQTKAMLNPNNKGNGMVKGYRGLLETGYQTATGAYGLERIKLHYINAYQFNPFITSGIGTGITLYHEGDGGLIVPLYAYFRATILNSSVSPFISAGAGYSFDAANGFSGVGVMINPAIGVNFKLSGRSNMNFGLGYDLQMMDFLYGGYVLGQGYYVVTKEPSSAISINLGFSF